MTQPVRDTAGVETSLQRPGFAEGDRCWRQSRPIQKMPKHLLQAHKAQKQREVQVKTLQSKPAAFRLSDWYQLPFTYHLSLLGPIPGLVCKRLYQSGLRTLQS